MRRGFRSRVPLLRSGAEEGVTAVHAQAVSARRCFIAVVGAGASGTLTAAALLRLGARRDDLVVHLIDPGVTARGVAYGTADERHLLNVPAGRMSADPTSPLDFLRWVIAHRRPGARAADYLPRRWYGEYLEHHLDQAARGSRAGLHRLHDQVQRLIPSAGSYRIVLAGGQVIRADQVVLALGNPAPATSWAPPELLESPRFHPDPWAPGVPSELAAAGDRVLLVGCGLTMVDVAIGLDRPGRVVHAVSRTGLVPRTHARVNELRPPLPAPALPLGAVTLPQLRALVATQMSTAQRIHGDWRLGFDSLRPVTNDLWQRLGMPDQERFLASGSREWDVLRHRMAPAVAGHLEQMQRGRRLRMVKGRVNSSAERDDSILVTIGRSTTLTVDAVVNCTGPATLAQSTSTNPLLADLLARGLARSHRLGLGLDVDQAGHALDRHGRPSPGLLVIGPLRRGALWETTAIPEIRIQAGDCAREALAALPAVGGVTEVTRRRRHTPLTGKSGSALAHQ
jgi:uncharacterized NAD(P)/FAD-binding protein YdhS